MTLWTPAFATLSGSVSPKAWWKADGAGNTLGSNGKWTDETAGALVMQNTGGSATTPTVTAAAINGLPSVDFNGTTDNLLTTTNLGISGGQARTFFSVAANPNNFAGDLVYWHGSNSTGQGYGLSIQSPSPASYQTWVSDAAGSVATTAGDFHVYDMWNNTIVTSGLVQGVIDGTADGNNSGVTLNTGGGSATPLYMGARSGTASSHLRLPELVIYDVLLNAADIALLEGYLAWKYGLQGLLPVGHTYKSAAPTTGGTTYNVDVAEAGSAADTVSALASLIAAIAESGAGADTVSSKATLPASWSDTGAAVDTVSSKATVGGVILEAGAVANATASQGVLVGALAEAGSASDQAAQGSLYAATIAEAGSAADSVDAVVISRPVGYLLVGFDADGEPVPFGLTTPIGL